MKTNRAAQPDIYSEGKSGELSGHNLLITNRLWSESTAVLAPES